MKETAVITCGNVNYAVHRNLVTRVLGHLNQQVVPGRDSSVVKKCDFLEWLFSLTKLRSSNHRISSIKIPLLQSVLAATCRPRSLRTLDTRVEDSVRDMGLLYRVMFCQPDLCIHNSNESFPKTPHAQPTRADAFSRLTLF